MHKAQLWIREKWGGPYNSKPYLIDLTFDKKTTIKKIIADMVAQGFGTRKFEHPEPVKETNGDIPTAIQGTNGNNTGLAEGQQS